MYGLYGKAGHDILLNFAFKNILCPTVLDNLKTLDHTLDVQYLNIPLYHCMMAPPRGVTSMEHAIAVAKSQILSFRIATRLTAKRLANENNCGLALDILDMGLHSIADCTSPAHVDRNGNPQVWNSLHLPEYLNPQWLFHGDWPWPNFTGLSRETTSTVDLSVSKKLKKYFDEAFVGTPCEKDGTFMIYPTQ